MNEALFKLIELEQSDTYGKFSIEPLANGFGHTLGNALRRILLSNLKGAAITKIKVDGLQHKFSTLEGLNEDTIDLVLNLKKVKVAYDKDEPVTARLEVKGPATVTAKDIILPPTVKLVNPDTVIATLAKGAKLDMEIQIESGYGYSPADDRKAELLGEIPVDALYSPVERVAYDVDQTRVGRQTDFDKLVIEIYTDGTQMPIDVLKTAARIAVTYFKQIYDPTEIVEEEPEEIVEDLPEEYALTVEELGLPTRIANALKNGGFKTVKDLAGASLKDLKSVKNLGGKSIDVVRDALKSKKVTLKEE